MGSSVKIRAGEAECARECVCRVELFREMKENVRSHKWLEKVPEDLL